MLQVAQVAVCSQINTKHINTVWAERTVVEMLNCWCITSTVGCKSLMFIVSYSKFNSLF